MEAPDEKKIETPDTNPSTDTDTPVTPEQETNESFLGSMLVIVLLLLLVGVIVFFGFMGFRIWRESQVVKNTPSIQKLSAEQPTAPVAAPSVEPGAGANEQAPTTPSTPSIDKAKLEVKVLNGGAAKGSAGTLTETLKKAGFSEATFGNTTTDFTGTTVYHASGKQAEAELVKAEVVKTYPRVTVVEAKANDRETAAAPVVVILGK